MFKNENLRAARAVKNDEFYTRLCDIEQELVYYKQHFRDKIIYCNCDDPALSNFWRYFHLNFSFLGLRGLISTHLSLNNPSYVFEYFGGDDGYVNAGVLRPLSGSGDFRSDECVYLLKQADIIITNPPFSLFREYIGQLMKYNKKFLIIGSMNAITYKEFFPLIRDNKIWLGYTSPKAFECFNGDLQKFGNIFWYTNLDISKRHAFLPLYRKYTPEDYPFYINYNAIEVSRVSEIPVDYPGNMGVPISFLEKYCPEQFEIIGASRWLGRPMSEIAARGLYTPGGIRFYLPCPDGKYKRLYDRIVIRHK